MGSSRSQQPQRQASRTPEEAQAAIAAMLASGLAPPALVSALAPQVLLLLPAPLLLRSAGLAADVAEEVARLLADVEPPDLGRANAGIVRSAALDVLAYRAAYARAAATRLSRAVLGAEGGRRRETLSEALQRERGYLSSHEEVSRRRMAAARAAEQLAELHGPILGWLHGETRAPEEPRPSHKAAHRHNFDLRRGIPARTGALPGVLPHCSCAMAPPIDGAAMVQ